MPWLELHNDIEDMFSIMNVPVVDYTTMSSLQTYGPERAAYMRDWKKTPVGKANQKACRIRYESKPEVKARKAQKAKDRRAARKLAIIS